MVSGKNSNGIRMEKIVAAGNDFLFVLSGRDVRPQWRPTASFVRAICDRHFGVGADGFILLNQQAANNFEWHFYNSDGSEAAMCGNAARAAARLLISINGNNQNWPVVLKTGFGEVLLEATGTDEFSVIIDYSKRPLALTPITSVATASAFAVGGAILIDTGVPHVVIEKSDEILKFKDRSLAAPYRWAKEAGQAGANVTFFRRIQDSLIEAITFERGVEDYTLSCGTGVLAAATVAFLKRAAGPGPLQLTPSLQKMKWTNAISVQNPGGLLRVSSADFPTKLTLFGPANTVFTTESVFDSVFQQEGLKN